MTMAFPTAVPLVTGALDRRAHRNVCDEGETGILHAASHVVLAGLLVVAVTGPARAADVGNGSRIFAKHCAACHGPRGISVMPGAPHLARGERMMQSDLALLASLKVGKGAMPAYLGILSDREILDVIAYSRTLR